MSAAERGDILAVKALLEQGANVNARRTGGWTPLMLAAEGRVSEGGMLGRYRPASADNRIETVRILLAGGADVNARDRYGATVLMRTVDSYDPPLTIVERLIQAGADVNLRDHNGTTALIRACDRGATFVVEKLLETGADVRPRDRFSRTALLAAIDTSACRSVIVRKLLQQGADPRDAYSDGTTALMAAFRIRSGETLELDARRQIVEWLLTDGADPHAQNKIGETVLMAAAEGGQWDSMRRLLAYKISLSEINAKDRTGQTALTYAGKGVFHDYKLISRALLEQGALPVGRDEIGQTPLMIAAEASAVEVVRLMLARGADVNARDDQGRTAIMCCDNATIYRLLMEKGARTNVRDREGRTLLMMAAASGKRSVVEYLLKCGVDVQSRDNAGRNALMYAGGSEVSQVEGIVHLLLARGLDINAQDSKGQTALHHAAAEAISHHGTNVLETDARLHAYIRSGAGVNVSDREGVTPLLLLAEMGHPLSEVEFLVERGADINHRDQKGRSTLVWMLLYENQEGVEFLRRKGARIELLDAVLMKDSAAALTQIRQGAKIDVQGPFRLTPLMIAAENGMAEVVAALLERGADPHARDVYRRTPLHIAVGALPRGLKQNVGRRPDRTIPEGDRYRTVAVLLRYGADANSTFVPVRSVYDFRSLPSPPESVLESALYWKHDTLVTLLEEHGARKVGGWRGSRPFD